jgi:hypothetical protein
MEKNIQNQKILFKIDNIKNFINKYWLIQGQTETPYRDVPKRRFKAFLDEIDHLKNEFYLF